MVSELDPGLSGPGKLLSFLGKNNIQFYLPERFYEQLLLNRIEIYDSAFKLFYWKVFKAIVFIAIKNYVSVKRYLFGWRCGGLMVTAFDSSLSGPGLSPGWGHCVVLLGKTLYSHSASFHPGV